MHKMMWAYFINLGVNMWGDEGCDHRYSKFFPEMITDDDVWREVIDFLPTGIVRTSVAFWVLTYLSQYLGFTAGVAATIYTIMTVVQSVSPYITNVVIYEYLLKRNMNRMLLCMFGVSAVSFVVMFAVQSSFVNIVFLTLAIMTANGAANTMWNVYCPSLHHTGMVSTATGYLDFVSYLAAGIANQLFANAISQIGWGNLILVWAILMGTGVIITIPSKTLLKIKAR